jgi:hypothetical protein
MTRVLQRNIKMTITGVMSIYEHISTANLPVIAMVVQLPSRTASWSQGGRASDPDVLPKNRQSIATRMNTKVTMIEALVLHLAIRSTRGAKILTRRRSDCDEARL